MIFMKETVFIMFLRKDLYLYHVLECLTTTTITGSLFIMTIIGITTIEEEALELTGFVV